MDSNEIKEIIADHHRWLINEGGKRANLMGADLSRADLSEANLSEANLSYANLMGADLSRADLSEANLREADLRGADLRKADLSYADLREANLREANLREADLRGADLRKADLRKAKKDNTILSMRHSNSLKDAIEVAKDLISGKKTAKELNLFEPDRRAAVIFYTDHSGGFCIVPKRKEIWHWNWACPNSETVTVLWKMED